MILFAGLIAFGVWSGMQGDSSGVVSVVSSSTKTPGQITVLIVYESEDLAKPAMAPYVNTIHSASLMTWLNSHCGKDGGRPLWRILDKDTPGMESQPASIREAWAAKSSDLPSLTIVGPRKKATGPLPKTLDATMAELKKWGGE